MRTNRRDILALGVCGWSLFAMAPAFAMSEDEARATVQATIEDLISLLKLPGSTKSIAPRLREIMERRANMTQIAKFSAGRVWLEMSAEQQGRFQEAFAHYVSTVYAKRFKEVSGNPSITIDKVIDAGRKGFLVNTPVTPPEGQPLSMDWLVSDRGGKVEIIDIVVEGISLAATQREEIAAMFQQRGQNVDALISALESPPV